jgi:DNA-binding NtrC family response regulator
MDGRDAKTTKIMVVGDVEDKLGLLLPTLFLNSDILCFGSGCEAEASLTKQDPKIQERVGVIICEQNLRDMAGSNFLERSISMIPRARRILLIDYPQLDMDALLRAQLFRFITKPYSMENLVSTIRVALEEMEKEQLLICDQEILGQDPKFLEVLDLVRRVSNSQVSVLVRGETGTGKELIARALHCNGPGKGRPYTVINCCALPETLFEAEMFGHKKGAFTSAYQDRKGRVKQAEGGTLFIDEVGEIPVQVQAKLLRFLQFGEFQRVGSDCIETANVRIVAATNQDLEKRMKEGTFRKDLYYRLSVLEVTLPPLRERPSDICLLTGAFIKKYWPPPGSPILSDYALKVLKAYDYPGNVRELENVIQRACLLARTEEIDLDVLPPKLIKKVRESAVLSHVSKVFPRLDKELLKKARIEAGIKAENRVEREFLNQLMSHFDTVVGAAAHAGMQRTYLHRLLTKHGFRHPK